MKTPQQTEVTGFGTARPDLADQWHPMRNGDVTPSMVNLGSSARAFWWLCAKGHEWQARVKDRARRDVADCPFCMGKRPWRGFNDLGTVRPDVAVLWHPTKNQGLVPQETLPGSHAKRWWLCATGHEWQAPVRSLTQKDQWCPYCSGKRVIPGVSDLATTDPEVAAQWHPTKNQLLKPQDVGRGSMKEVWWVGACAHSWRASINNRSRGAGCPYCTGRRALPGFNDLATQEPEVAARWHPTQNGSLTASDVTCGSDERAWWTGDCGHEWRATVGSQVRGGGCAVCAGKIVIPGDNDLATSRPDLAKEWHPTKNGSWTPRNVTYSSGRIYWWVCCDGHSWRATAASRAKGNGCPVCSGREVLPGFNDLATKNPRIAAEWHPERNGDLTPAQVTEFSGRRVWWRCGKGHEWRTTVGSRTFEDSHCRRCSAGTRTSKIELELRGELVAAGLSVSDDRFLSVAWGNSTEAECDIVLPGERAVIEYDGGLWHRDRTARDQAKSRALLDAGWTVVRVREHPLDPLPIEHSRYAEIDYNFHSRDPRGLASLVIAALDGTRR